VEAIERGESCTVGLLVDIHQERTKSSIFRFESLVRMALKEQGRFPIQRRPGTVLNSSLNDASTDQTSSAKSVELALFEREGQHLIDALGERLEENDLTSARQVRAMLRDLHIQMGRL